MASRGPIPRSALDNFEQDLLELLFQCSDELPRAGNGRPIASGDSYADQVLKDMRGGVSREVRRVVAVLLSYLNRGAKRARVRLFTQRLDAIVAAYGRTDEPRPIRYLNRRETREDGLLDLAQLRLEADPDDLEALTGLIRQASFYRAAFDDLIEEAQDAVVRLRGGVPADVRHLALVET